MRIHFSLRHRNCLTNGLYFFEKVLGQRIKDRKLTSEKQQHNKNQKRADDANVYENAHHLACHDSICMSKIADFEMLEITQKYQFDQVRR